METRVIVSAWKESSLNNETYKGYIKTPQFILLSSVDGSDDLVRINDGDGKEIVVMASDIITAVKKITL